MAGLYRRWMEGWEKRLCFRATNRVVRPFEWGPEWAKEWPCAQENPRNGHDAESYLRLMNRLAVSDSDSFFAYDRPHDFALENGLLRFTSPVQTPHPKNNVVHGQWFPARTPGKAVIVLPHWNARADQHGGLCRGLQRLGISTLRLSLPYHDYRMPPELERADYAVSANVGRTIDATRQAVIDARACLDWLTSQGYDRLGIIGTSLGSCYAFLTSAHDARLRVNVYNHCSSHFADVVWTGLSTRHIRQSLEQEIDVDRLRQAWMALSPVNYMAKYAAAEKKSLFIYTLYDTTFLPRYSEEILAEVRAHGLDPKIVALPCGHYTMGEAPFKFVDGYHICSFLRREL